MNVEPVLALFGAELSVVNVGLESFATDLRSAGGSAVDVDWRPPAGGDPAAALLLFDCVIGYGSHPDPAGLLAEGVDQARRRARGRELVAIASVTGTDGDRQGYETQGRRLADAGVTVETDNRRAAQFAAAVLGRAAR